MRRCLLIMLSASLAYAQAPPSSTLKFEVASLKPTPPGARGGGIRPAPGGERYQASNLTLKALIAVAYHLKETQIVGGPGWINTESYDMNAKAERSSSLEELHVMLGNLLVERFKLGFHRETKELPVYVLTVDKGDPKLKPHSAQNAGDAYIQAEEKKFLHMTWTATASDMSYFAWRLSQILDRPVLDQTKLKGGYDFELTFTRIPATDLPPGAVINGEPIDTSGPTIFDAVRRQLGLRLEAQRAPAETIVIDRAEKPAEN